MSQNIQMKIKKIPSRGGKLIDMPCYKSEYAAGMDLCANIDAPLVLKPFDRTLVPSGIAIEICDSAYAAFVFARSGISSKHGICLANGVGVIDNDYRGEIKICLINLSMHEYEITPHERIAQLVLLPVAKAQPLCAEFLSSTQRAKGGFGSTGQI